MNQVMVYGFCILAALILAVMLICFYFMKKDWERQIQDLKKSGQNMKDYHDILLIDMRSLLQDQEEAAIHLCDSLQNIKGLAKGAESRIKGLQKELDGQEESFEKVRKEMQSFQRGAKALAEDAADVMKKVQKTENCSQSVKDEYGEFLEKHKAQSASARCVQSQAELLNGLQAEFSNMGRLFADFTDQLELISLNADIEAAKGENEGQGFSVIALEMRKISEEGRELFSSFMEKNRLFEEYARQNKDNIDKMIQLQEAEQMKITKTGFLLEQMNQEAQKALWAAQGAAGGIKEFETAGEKALVVFDDLSAIKDHERENEIMPKELQGLLKQAAKEGSSFKRMTEEMRSRIAQ